MPHEQQGTAEPGIPAEPAETIARMDRYTITPEDESGELRRLFSHAALDFTIGGLPVSLEFNLFRYGYDVRRGDETYRHPAPVSNRLFFFYRRGGEIRIDGERHEFRPGVLYLLARDHPFVVTYHDGSELLYAHFSLVDHTRRPLFRNAPGFSAVECPQLTGLLKPSWESGSIPAVTGGILNALSGLIDPAVRGMETEYRLFLRFQPVFDYLSRTPPGRLRVGEMAEQMKMTQAAFSRSFSAALGVSPKTYMENIYLARAKELLLFSSRNVDAIARELGHAHPHYFHTVFLRMTGTSPGEFRRKNLPIS